MQICYNNARQEEFSALVRKLEGLGWNYADVARELGVSKATITNILKAKQTPRVPTLDSLRNITQLQDSVKLVNQSDENAHDQLRELAAHDPAGFAAAQATIAALHGRILIEPPNSKLTSVAAKLLKKAVVAVRKPDPK